ncbi:Opine oxidase subunit A [Rhodovastum atsumiense]|uniref:NAD(P)-binding protein n=1 Tax=Rhodovastum atsumiense TaxID=504468 RepID=A0A5M6INZ0_9PROT|nr:NAD(P)/FAD-dependent oxidoreductase [Rhodovastum atsumiense]KAA5609972.1 NAD(P)-binding protein [Rhodovastum atsumiense]CAH2598612.1 Opine oxidase subunit A [Rhodovastum atsumiense]
MSTVWDAIVIGAGPAGLAAASLLAEQGAQVVVLDEQPAPGGQIYRAIEAGQANAGLLRILGPEYAHGGTLAARFRASGASYRPGTQVWQVTAEREVWVTSGGRSELLQGRAVVLATGAMERPVPVPGWTLPGVMTAGAVQILLKSAQVLPAEGLVLAGSGPLLSVVAMQCLRAGVKPAAILETATRADALAALRHLPAALGRVARGYLLKGVQMKLALWRAGIPVFREVSDIRIEGDTEAQAVSFRTPGGPRRVAATLVALHEGVVPMTQVTRSLGCEHVWDDAQCCFRPVLDSWGNSSVPGFLVAGDGGGIGGALAAEHAGRIAAWEVLHQLGRIDAARRDAGAAPDRRELAAHLAIRPLLERIFRPRAEILTPADEVVVCRCEEITAGQVREVVRHGCLGPNQAKSFLRAGMGPCQGRMCGLTVSALIAAERGIGMDEVGYFRIRPPLKPVTVGELAAMDIPR